MNRSQTSLARFDLGVVGIEKRAAGSSALGERLLRVVDGSIAGAIFLVPWCMGGRHPLGELVLAVFAVAAGLAWTVREQVVSRRLRWQRSPADVVFLTCLALVVLQLMPLPPAVLHALSPHLRNLLPLHAPGSGIFPAWDQVSLTPYDTLASGTLLVAYGLLFFVTLQRVERLSDVERILRWVAMSITLMAGFGLLQYLTSNGKFLWFYKHPYRHTFLVTTGMFANRNHFAHLLALGVGPLLWCLQYSLQQPKSELERLGDRDRWRRQFAWMLALAVVFFAALMSLSRGGIAAIALATLTCGAAFYRRGLLSTRFVLWSGAVVLLVVGCLFVYGSQAVVERLDDYATGSLQDLDQDGARREIWTADFKAAQDFLTLGSGIGSHREVYPMYLAAERDTEFTHAENGYLQVSLEAGLPGLALLLVALGCAAAWCRRGLLASRSSRAYLLAAAITASLTVSAAHSLVDFVWYIPSCLAVTLVLAACAFRLAQFDRPPVSTKKALPRPLAWAGAMCVALVGAWMIHDRACATIAAPHLDAYLEIARSPDVRSGRVERDVEIIEHLEQVLFWTPGNARAHLQLADACLRRFEKTQQIAANAMPLSQIRDAALASGFSSSSELNDWLWRAVEDRRRLLDLGLSHARRAAACCPLEGEAYICLAQLSFLESPAASIPPALIEQAVRVRPYDGTVLMGAGSELALRNNYSQALEYWRRAFRCGAESQRQFARLWAGSRMPVDIILESLQPDLSAVRLLAAEYAQSPQADDRKKILAYYAQIGRSTAAQLAGPEAARVWFELHDVYHHLGDVAAELDVLRRACSLEPGNYQMHHELGIALCRDQQFAEAEEHLRWCTQRKPEDELLAGFLAAAVRGKAEIRQASATESTQLLQR